jgi:hypothetical protein
MEATRNRPQALADLYRLPGPRTGRLKEWNSLPSLAGGASWTRRPSIPQGRCTPTRKPYAANWRNWTPGSERKTGSERGTLPRGTSLRSSLRESRVLSPALSSNSAFIGNGRFVGRGRRSSFLAHPPGARSSPGEGRWWERRSPGRAELDTPQELVRLDTNTTKGNRPNPLRTMAL